jgi:hypothetical protein
MFCFCSHLEVGAMADGTTWLGQPIGLQEFLAGARVIATCTACGAIAEVEPVVAFRASPIRLADAIRCTCGSRRGRIGLATEVPHPAPDSHRCYLFHV